MNIYYGQPGASYPKESSHKLSHSLIFTRFSPDEAPSVYLLRGYQAMATALLASPAVFSRPSTAAAASVSHPAKAAHLRFITSQLAGVRISLGLPLNRLPDNTSSTPTILQPVARNPLSSSFGVFSAEFLIFLVLSFELKLKFALRRILSAVESVNLYLCTSGKQNYSHCSAIVQIDTVYE